jgi:hypothetical protein
MEGSQAGVATTGPADSDVVEIPPRRSSVLKKRDRLTGTYRRRVSPAARARLSVAAAGYAVVVVFATSLAIARAAAPGWSWTVDFILASAVAAPLALAFLYERLTALKTPWFEIALTSAKVEITGSFARALEEAMLQASGNRQLTEAVSALLAPNAPKVIRLNLRSEPYWWSTRLFLLAALSTDYTAVQRIAFVEGGAARRYVGLAPPDYVRTTLAARFPNYERAYTQLRSVVSGEPRLQVEVIVGGWQNQLLKVSSPAEPPADPRTNEEFVKEYVTALALNEWLSGVMDTGYVMWDGWPQDPRLRAAIIGQEADYVALVQDGRLDSVVSRDILALNIARGALKLDAGEPDR